MKILYRGLTNKGKGVLLMCLSAFSFSVMQIAVKATEELPLFEQLFPRHLATALFCFLLLKKQDSKGIKEFLGEKRYQPLLFTRSICGFAGLLTMFYATVHANQADVAILTKLSPFLITVWAAIFLGEKITGTQILVLLLAFIGVLVVANSKLSSDIIPLLVAFSCSLLSSISYTLLAYFNNKVDGLIVILHFGATSLLLTTPLMCMNFVMPNLEQFFLLAMVGIFGAAGQFAITYAYRFAPAGEVSIYSYTAIPFTIILAAVFIKDGIFWSSILGGGIIIIASIISFKHNGEKRTVE